ncbi:MAG: hypothetical protein LBG78_01765 [Azoarcus sp.]|jgi:iron complex transport system substrate-binding protein|nr:hypothetical protein [Azoarcus sp.]
MLKALITALAFLAAPTVFAQTQLPQPQRIVSLDLCTDWMLALHVEPTRVAALSPMQRISQPYHPAPWMKNIWPTHEGNLESIALLKPDIILAGEYTAVLLRGQLKRLGYRVEVLPLPTTLKAVVDYERLFLTLVGLPPERASTLPPALPSGKKRLLLLGANAIGTGRDTFEDAIITQAGWRNYFKESESGLIRLDAERLVLDPPDAVLWMAPSGAAHANILAEHPIWQTLNPSPRRINTDYWRWQCPGPWVWELMRELNQMVQE